MYDKASVLAVLGHKNSGKTTVVEGIIKVLIKSGYRVATAKHISQTGFSIDTVGKDTWKHSKAGANPVVSVSQTETAILIKDDAAKFTLEKLYRFTAENDAIILEGFSQIVMDDPEVAKIICVRNKKEYNHYMKETKGKIIAFCSTKTLGKPILRIGEDFSTIIKQTLNFFVMNQKT